MKKYITMDFDEKGAPIMGAAKNRPAQGFAFVPSGWVPPTPPTPVEEGDGIKSLAISPVLETTPALDSVFPIYWDDLTDEEKEDKEKTIVLTTEYQFADGDEITVTASATPDWYVSDGDDWSAKGGSISTTGMVAEAGGKAVAIVTVAMAAEADFDSETYFEIKIMLNRQIK